MLFLDLLHLVVVSPCQHLPHHWNIRLPNSLFHSTGQQYFSDFLNLEQSVQFSCTYYTIHSWLDTFLVACVHCIHTCHISDLIVTFRFLEISRLFMLPRRVLLPCNFTNFNSRIFTWNHLQSIPCGIEHSTDADGCFESKVFAFFSGNVVVLVHPAIYTRWRLELTYLSRSCLALRLGVWGQWWRNQTFPLAVGIFYRIWLPPLLGSFWLRGVPLIFRWLVQVCPFHWCHVCFPPIQLEQCPTGKWGKSLGPCFFFLRPP